MTRRGERSSQVESDHDSLKENRGVTSTTSVKTRPKREKKSMINGTSANSKRARIESDEEEPEKPVDVDTDAQEVSEEEEQDGSPKGQKRARTNTIGDSVPGGSQDIQRLRTVTQPRDTDGYIPGSIVRIQLKNFVTYDFVEFAPGPYLNMILGPNGTGKSSIACAICLGLNFPPSTLGRASQVNLFVKNTTDSGHIEIELKGSKGKPNLVIRRSLVSASNSSTWTLNGKPTTAREVTEKVASLNVQVGNLCSFLPQDKVSEFAQMSPQQLLRETQRAAGNENLTRWHDTLINRGKELKVMAESLQNDQDHLKTLQDRNAAVEREVERFRERKRIERNIELLKVLIPVQEYREKRINFLKLKERQRVLHAKVAALRTKNAPAVELQQKIGAQQENATKERNETKKIMKAKVAKMQEKYSSHAKLETHTEKLQDELRNLKRTEKERIGKIKKAEKDIETIKDSIKAHAREDIEDPETIKEEGRQLLKQRAPLTAQYTDLQARQRVNADRAGGFKFQKSQAEDDLKKLDDVNERRMAQLRAFNQDTHDAIMWLRRNRTLFKMEVFEPAYVSISVPQREYAQAVENLINATQLKTFVAQCPEDYDTLNKNLNDDRCLGRAVTINTWYRPCNPNNLVPPPLSREEMTTAGFQGYAIDFIECAEGHKVWLTHELNLHRNAIGLGRVDVGRAMELVSRLGPNGQGGGATFIAGNSLNTVGRSRYGRRAVFNNTKDLSPAKIYILPSADPEVKQRCNERITEANRELHLLNEQDDILRAEDQEIRSKEDAIKKQIDKCNARKQAIEKHIQSGNTLRRKLDGLENGLQRLQSQPSSDDQKAKIQKELAKVVQKRVDITTDYARIAQGIVADNHAATAAGLRATQLSANVRVLKDLCDKKDNRLNRALIEYTKVDKEYREMKAEAKEHLHDSRALIQSMSAELKELYDAIELPRQQYDTDRDRAEQEGRTIPPVPEGLDQRSSEEMREGLEAEKAKLELSTHTNHGVVEAYQKRKEEIKSLSKKIEDKERRVSKVENEIRHAKNNWYPALKLLVESIGRKFSAAFDRIGCAGEIRIGEHEDFDKWTIDILVKFRDDEKLQVLTAQRQSGGERSLTTILYLMSLTEEARAPFSLVDEINQGMDSRAERVVHNSMVEVTCKEESAQYFLITPKLLADLQYHERMKVLCVNNGEWLPEEEGMGNMLNLIEGYLSHKASRSANSA